MSLSQGDEAVAHGPGYEPLMSSEAVGAAVDTLGNSGELTEVSARLAFGDGEAQKGAVFVSDRALRLVVAARADEGQPGLGQPRCMAERCNGGVGGGELREVTGLDASSKVDAGGTGNGAHAAFRPLGVPDGRMEPGGDAPPHQGVIGGVEFDEVDAGATGIVRAQKGSVFVGEATELRGLLRAPECAVLSEIVRHGLGYRVGQRDQRRVRLIKILAEERRR